MRPVVPDKGGDALGMSLRGIHALQKLREPKTRDAPLETDKAEQQADIDTLASRERELFHRNRRPEDQLAGVKVEKECHKTPDKEMTKATIHVKIELAKGQWFWPMLEGQALADRSAMRTAVDDCYHVKGEDATAFRKAARGKRVRTATSNNFKRHSNKVEVVIVVAQERMRTYLQKYIQTIYDRYLVIGRRH